MSKKKRAERRRQHAKQLMKQGTLQASPRKQLRGRPRELAAVGPTPQTVAKLKPDTLDMLARSFFGGQPFLSPDLVEAGNEVLRAWTLITAQVGFRSGSSGVGHDRDSAVRLQAVWRRWCGQAPRAPSDAKRAPHVSGLDELYRRCRVRPSVIVNWLQDSTDIASCFKGIDPKGAAGLLRKALEWWQMAARDVAKAR